MVRMNSPAPTMSSRLKLICSATQVRRNFNAPPEPVPPCCLRDSTRRGFQNCIAGARLNNRLAMSAAATVKSRTRQSRVAEKVESGLRPAIQAMRALSAGGAINRPATALEMPSRRPSARSWRRTCQLVAPRAKRMENSRTRAAALTSSRPAILTTAIAMTRVTMPIMMKSGMRRSSRSGEKPLAPASRFKCECPRKVCRALAD